MGEEAHRSTGAKSSSHGEPLTAASRSYEYQEADFAIAHQSGADFSVGKAEGGAIFSAGGGHFQYAVQLGGGTAPTLDPATTAPRYVWFAAIGKPGVGPDGAGIDLSHPIVGPQSAQTLLPGCITYAKPGESVFQAALVTAINFAAADSIHLDSLLQSVMIWQV